MVKALCHTFNKVTLFSFIYSEPEEIESLAKFINGTAIIFSQFSPQTVKLELNKIEESLGRDRSDPNRSLKDRTADIDLLGSSKEMEINHFLNEGKSYISGSVLGSENTVDLSEYGLPTIQGSATVHLDARSGNIVIINDRHNGLINGQKTAFTL